MASWIQQVHLNRDKSDHELLRSSYQQSRAYLKQWPTQLQQALEQGSRMSTLDSKEQQAFLDKQKPFVCAINLKNINHYGLVVKEQCLTLDQLEGESGVACGPEALKKSEEMARIGGCLRHHQ